MSWLAGIVLGFDAVFLAIVISGFRPLCSLAKELEGLLEVKE